jgi:hypothetical protein
LLALLQKLDHCRRRLASVHHDVKQPIAGSRFHALVELGIALKQVNEGAVHAVDLLVLGSLLDKLDTFVQLLREWRGQTV